MDSPRPHSYSRTRLITRAHDLDNYITPNTYLTERWLGFFTVAYYLTWKLLQKAELDYLTAWNYAFLYHFFFIMIIQPQDRNAAIDTLTAFSQALWLIMRFESQADCLGFMIFHEVLGLGYCLFMNLRKNPKLSFRGFMIHGSTEGERFPNGSTEGERLPNGNGSRKKERSVDADESSDEEDNEESQHILGILFNNQKLNKILVVGYILSFFFNMGQVFFGGN